MKRHVLRKILSLLLCALLLNPLTGCQPERGYTVDPESPDATFESPGAIVGSPEPTESQAPTPEVSEPASEVQTPTPRNPEPTSEVQTSTTGNAASSTANTATNRKDPVTIYLVREHPLERLIEEYNQLEVGAKVNVVTFDSPTQLNNKLSAELMAGKGPDLVLYDSDYNGVSNLEKMMAQNMFVNFDDLIVRDSSATAPNWEDYYETILDSGIYGGKRYFMPISYMPDILITTSELCEKYHIPTDSLLTYQTAEDIFSHYLAAGEAVGTISMFYYINEEILSLIDQNIDFFSRESRLDDQFFRTNLDSLTAMILPADRSNYANPYDPLAAIAKERVLFASLYQITGSQPTGLAYAYNELSTKGKTPIIFSNFSDGSSIGTAFFDKGFLISSASANKEGAYEFVKYMLRQDTQENLEIGLPVNRNAQAKLLDEMDAEEYDQGTVSDSFKESYMAYLESVTACRFRNDYFNYNLVNDVVSQYIAGRLTQDQFLQGIQSRTNLYLGE